VFSPPEDVDAFVATLRGLAADPARNEALGQNGRRYAEANYSRPVLAARYADLLAGLLKQ
jgi:glycosyltransferase involved in cell wall biosynthesis